MQELPIKQNLTVTGDRLTAERMRLRTTVLKFEVLRVNGRELPKYSDAYTLQQRTRTR